MSKILRCEVCSTFCTTEEALEKHKIKHKRDEDKEKDGNSDKKSKPGSKDEKIKKDESDRSRSSKRESKDSSSHSRRSSRSNRSSDRSKIRSRSRDGQRGSSNDRSRRSGYRSDSSRDRHSYHRRDRHSSRSSRRHDDKREDEDADLSELLNSGEWEVTDEVVDDEMDVEEEKKVDSSSKGNDSKSIANDTSGKNSSPPVTDDKEKEKPTSTVDNKDTPVATDKKDDLSEKPTEEAVAKINSEETNDNGLEEVSDVATEDEDTAERKSVVSTEDDTVTKGQTPATTEKLTPGKAGSRKEAGLKETEESDKEDLGEEFVPSRMTSLSKHATQTNQNFSTFRDCGSISKHHNKNLRHVTVVVKKLDAKKLSSDLKISAFDIALMSNNKENVDYLICQQILESVVKKVIEQERPKQPSVKQSQPKRSAVKPLEHPNASVKRPASKLAVGKERSNEAKDSQLTNFKNYRIPKLSEKKNVQKDKGNTDGKVKKYRRIIRGRESAGSDGKTDKKISKSSDGKKISKSFDGKMDKKIFKSSDGKTDKKIAKSSDGKTDKKISKSSDGKTKKKISKLLDGKTEKLISKSPDGKIEKPITKLPDGKIDKKISKSTDIKHREEKHYKTDKDDRRTSRSRSPLHRRSYRDGSREKLRYDRSRSPFRRDRKWSGDRETRRADSRDLHGRKNSHDRSLDRFQDSSFDRSYDRSRSPFRRRRSTSPNNRKHFGLSSERKQPFAERDDGNVYNAQPPQPSFPSFNSGMGQNYPPPAQFESYQKPPETNYYVEFNNDTDQVAPFNSGQYTVGFQPTAGATPQKPANKATATSNPTQFYGKPGRERVLRTVQRATTEEMTIAEAELSSATHFAEQGGEKFYQNKQNVFQGNMNMNANQQNVFQGNMNVNANKQNVFQGNMNVNTNKQNFGFQDNSNEMNFPQSNFNVHQNVQSKTNSMFSSNKPDTKDDAVRSMIREALSARMLELARAQNPANPGLKMSQSAPFSVQDTDSRLNVPLQNNYQNIVQNTECTSNFNELSNQSWSSQEHVSNSGRWERSQGKLGGGSAKESRLQLQPKANTSLLNPIEKIQIAEQLSAVLASMGNTNVSEDMLSRLVQQAITSKVSNDGGASSHQQSSYSFGRGGTIKSHVENTTNLGRNSRRVSVSFDESKQLPPEIKSSVSFDRSNPLLGRSGNTVSFDRSNNTVSFGGTRNTVSFDRSDEYQRSGNTVSFDRTGNNELYDELSTLRNTVSFDRSDNPISLGRLGPTASFQKSNAISFDRPTNTVSFDRDNSSASLSTAGSRTRKSRFEQSSTSTSFNMGSSDPQPLMRNQFSVSLGPSGNLYNSSSQFKNSSGNTMKSMGENWQSNQLHEDNSNFSNFITYPIGNFRTMSGNQSSKSSINMKDAMMGFGNYGVTENSAGRMQNQVISPYSSSHRRSGDSGVGGAWKSDQPTLGRYGY